MDATIIRTLKHRRLGQHWFEDGLIFVAGEQSTWFCGVGYCGVRLFLDLLEKLNLGMDAGKASDVAEKQNLYSRFKRAIDNRDPQ